MEWQQSLPKTNAFYYTVAKGMCVCARVPVRVCARVRALTLSEYLMTDSATK